MKYSIPNYSGPVNLGHEFEKAVNAHHFFYEELSYEEFEKGIIVPIGLPFHWGKTGGILDANNNYVEESALNEGIPGTVNDSSLIDWIKPDEKDENCIYLGQICRVWGHVFTDDIKRIWFLSIHKSKDFLAAGYKIVYTTMDNQPLPQYAIDIFLLAGLDITECERICHPTRFNKIILPDTSIRTCCGQNNGVRLFHPLFVDSIRTICKTVDEKNYPEIEYGKVYLTRTRFSESHKDFNEIEIEKFYSKKGYTIVSPEIMPVVQQIYLVRNAGFLATTDGSIGHMSIFCKPTTSITILLKADYVNPYQACISEVFNLNVSYRYAHHSFWANRKSPSNGPFYLCVTKYMDKHSVPVPFKFSYWKYLVQNCPVLLRIKRFFAEKEYVRFKI